MLPSSLHPSLSEAYESLTWRRLQQLPKLLFPLLAP
uniref:Uncharacterized protein n=1 Tax=Arundo donax TaxID=35708 RepID=A0A0A8Z4D7_ARUDO